MTNNINVLCVSFKVVDKNCNNTSLQTENNVQNVKSGNQNNSNKTPAITAGLSGVRNINISEQHQSLNAIALHGQIENADMAPGCVTPTLVKTTLMTGSYRADTSKQSHNNFHNKHTNTQQNNVLITKKSTTSPSNQNNSAPLYHLNVS